MTGPLRRIVLADSDAADLAAGVLRLRTDRHADVVTVTMDLGGTTGLEETRARALAAGASRAHVLDVRDAFVEEFVLPSLKADAVGRDGRPLAACLGRALVAQKLVEVAGIEQADAVAHGCRADEERVHFEAMIKTLNPALSVIEVASRPTVHPNLWGMPVRNGSNSAEHAGERDLTASAEIGFDRGIPTSVNGVPLSFQDLVASLNTIASTYRIERLVADFGDGASPPRIIHEMPAASLLHLAHEALRKLVMSDDFDRFWALVSRRYAELIEDGHWFTPMRHALDALVGALQERVSGGVTLQLRNGECRLVARHSVNAVTFS